METIDKYKEIIHQELSYRCTIPIANAPSLKRHLIVTKDGSEFLLLTMGWHKKHYRHNLVFHVEIKDGKVWVHEDKTDVGIATKFVENGIPKSDIVLGFLPKYAQEVSGFAVA